MSLRNTDSELLGMPWDQKPSIYEHIEANLDSTSNELSIDADKLPDEERINDGSGIRWASGAMDGVLGHHAGGDESSADEFVRIIQKYCLAPTAQNKLQLYRFVLDNDVLHQIDAILSRLSDLDTLNHERLYELAMSFLKDSPDREPVKLGAAILGMYRVPENEPLFQLLGRHDEFTLYAAVALANISDDPDMALWELAKNVHGWGRVQVVERLAGTEIESIKDWMVREGFRNNVMYEYLAFTCATTGELMAKLSEEVVDRELLTAAGELIHALIMGGPAEGMEEYLDGALATEMYLQHMQSMAETCQDFVELQTILSFVGDESIKWDEFKDEFWSEERRSSIQMMCQEILAREDWKEKAEAGLNSKSDVEFFYANQVASSLVLPTWSIHWNRLKAEPKNSGRWFDVMKLCNRDRIDQVIEYAESVLDLDSIAVGPGEAFGMGPGWESHQCLDFILQELDTYPGKGGRLIEAALQSEVIRHRNQAIQVLDRWGRKEWAETTSRKLEAALLVEPCEDVKKRMQRLAQGLPPDEEQSSGDSERDRDFDLDGE